MPHIRSTLVTAMASGRRIARYSWVGTRTIYRAAPLFVTGIVLLNVMFGISTTMTLLIQRAFVDELLPRLTADGSESIWSPTILFLLGAFLVVSVASDGVSTLIGFCLTGLRDRVQIHAMGRLFDQIARSSTLNLFEDHKRLNELQLARGGVQQLHRLGQLVSNLSNGIFMLVPTLALAAAIAWWIPFVFSARCCRPQ